MLTFVKYLLLAIIVFGFVVPFFFSKSYAMDRSTTIEAPAAEIAAVVGDLTTWDDWTVWNTEVDETLEREYSGTAGMPGHRMTWKGEELGEGSIEIKDVTTSQRDGGLTETRIAYDMIFDGSDPANCAIVLAHSGAASTGVTWEMSGEFNGMPFMRYFGLMMDGMVGPDFEEGLANLKKLVEEGAPGGAPTDNK
jgi:hypothetical protein